jgi:hypothetical protein
MAAAKHSAEHTSDVKILLNEAYAVSGWTCGDERRDAGHSLRRKFSSKKLQYLCCFAVSQMVT